MANLGGGAEAHARSQQYDYHANSNLVLTTDLQPHDKYVATSEPESLRGKVDPKSFGDRAACVMPPELERRIKNLKKKKELDLTLSEPECKKVFKRRRIEEESVLSLGDERVYKPKTKETLAAYENLLRVIQQQFGCQPQDVLADAANEILSVLKNEKIKNPGKKNEIEKLLNPITSRLFDQIVSIGQMITDFQHDDAGVSTTAVNGDNDAFDDDVGVAIEFEDEEEEESDFDQIHESE